MSTRAFADSGSATDTRSWSWHSGAAFVLPLVAVAGVGAANGGFFPTSFGWTGVAFAWVVVIAAVLLAPRWGRLDLVWIASAGALCVFMLCSAAWSGSETEAVNAGLRSLEYFVAVTGALMILRRRDLSRWLAGLVVGTAGVCVYALATRLAPGHFGGFDSSDYRLFVPVGYWNALGIFAVVALMLGLGVAGFGRGTTLRVAAAVAAVVLAPTLFFTFSRGSWAALIVGCLAALLVSPRRLRFVSAYTVLGAIPALAVLLASRKPALVDRGSTLVAAGHDGRRLALELILLAVGQAGVALAWVRYARRVQVSQVVRRGFAVVLVVAASAGLLAVIHAYGSPSTIARHAYDSFVSTPTPGSDLNGRLFTFSNNGRIVLWHAAWGDFTAHPVAGSGAGSFARVWLADRKSTYLVTDAHNLYVQTLAELGVVGFGLLLVLLVVPLLAAVRARREPLVAPAVGAYVAFIAHSTVDWDWQMPAVTLLALFVGAALVAAARTSRPKPIQARARVAVAAAGIAAAAIAFVGLIGNIALARSQTALINGDPAKAASEAARAHSWAPWSAEALKILGQAQALGGARKKGLDTLRQAARDDPGDWETWFDISALTRGAQARAALSRARRLNPASPEISDISAKP